MSSDNNQNILGYNSANNKFVSTDVVANADGSMIERQEYIQQNMNGTGVVYNAPNYLTVPITFASGTTGSVATHEIFTVTGLVRVQIIAVCSTNLAGATATIKLGTENNTAGFIAQTTATDVDAGELWYDATPTTTEDVTSTVVLDKVVNGADIGYEVETAAISGGVMTFHCWYAPLDSTGAVVVADGTGTL